MKSDAAAVGHVDPAAAVAWLAASPAALAGVSADDELLWANTACATLLGLNDDAVGRRLAGLIELSDHDALALQEARAAGGSVEVLRRRQGQSAGWLQIDVRVQHSGQRLLALRPLDRVQQAECEVRRLSQLLALVRDMGRVGLWERDLRSGLGRWDRNVFQMFGLEGEGEAPPWFDMLQHVMSADRLAFEQAWHASLREGGRHSLRFRLKGLDGQVRHLHSQWVVQAGQDGRPASSMGVITDDTQALALARSHDEMVSQLALAVDLAGIAIWRHDLATDRVHYNAQAWAVIDLEPRAEGLSTAEVRALIHPEDLPRTLASADTALQTDRPTDIEARYRRRDGAWRTVMTRRVVQRDAEGQPLAFLGVALDVTDRIDESRRAAELGRRFELATRAAGIGWWSLDDRAERARWSDQLRVIHGLNAGDPVPTLPEWLVRFTHPEDHDGIQRRFADWVKSGRPSLEADFRIVRNDGQVRHLITHSRVEGRDPASLLFGLVIDVTERRRVEMALRQASERAALAARGVGLGAWEHDLRNGSSYWDEQMWRLRGRTPRTDAPTEEERLAMVHPDDRAATRQINLETLSGDTPVNHEFRVVLPDGSVRWLASRTTPVCDEQGRTVRHIGVNWDVSDRRTAEAVRQEREIAQRESQAKSKFLARMSHELRTPLNAVLGFAQLLLGDDKGIDPAAASRRRRLQHIHAAGQHLLALINDVLDLSSLEGGEVQIAVQPVTLAPLVAQTLPLLEPLLREHRVELLTQAIDGVALVDPTRLRQVLLNLLSNAIKYNRDGGRVTLSAARRGSDVIVRVTDTGRGMSDLQMRHLFEPFNRLGIENEAIAGTGIGLAIVKALVERMGGSVHVDSTVGVGSVFELRLADGSMSTPEPSAEAPTSRPIMLAGAEQRPRGTLLYIEDNPVNAQIISELIARRPDLKLHVAVDGLSGVAQATTLRPDLVLLDMQLPDIDGHEVLRRLRAQPATQNIPVIALSANAMPEDIDRALRAGMSDYWTKPLDFRAFMASIDALFGPGG